MKKVLALVCALLLCLAVIPAVAEEAGYTETVVSINNGDHDGSRDGLRSHR